MSAVLWALALIFAQLSMLAFGGGNSVIPEMQRQLVEVHHWMSAQQFSALFALAQAAPGPNLMIVPLAGWHIAGWRGLVVTSVAMFTPSALLTGLALHLWHRFRNRPWRGAVQAGLMPITVGLIAASAVVISLAAVRSWPLAGVAALSAALMLATRVNPLLLLLLGALAGLTGIGQP